MLASDVCPVSGDQEGESRLVAVGLGVGRWSLETAMCGPTLSSLVPEKISIANWVLVGC